MARPGQSAPLFGRRSGAPPFPLLQSDPGMPRAVLYGRTRAPRTVTSGAPDGAPPPMPAPAPAPAGGGGSGRLRKPSRRRSEMRSSDTVSTPRTKNVHMYSCGRRSSASAKMTEATFRPPSCARTCRAGPA